MSRRGAARQGAYSSFTRKLLARDIVPGQLVTQRELVVLTGMTLAAVREMIPRLEAEGLIRTVPQRGLQVMTIDLELIRDAFQLRRIIEGEAFRAYCQTASDETLEAIADAHSDVRAAALGGVTSDLLARAQKMDWDFHDAAIDAMGNRILSDIHRVNAIKIRLIRNEDTRMLPELVTSVIDEHVAVIDALRARDPDAAVRAIQAHIDVARRRALDI
ncbi:MAG: GntR family transcriptional regulator [Paracoccaceae bacterium]